MGPGLFQPRRRGRDEAPAGSGVALEVDGLSLTVGGRTILDDVGFSMPGHGITALIGPSGAGKSTILRCLDLLQPDWQGTITIAGLDIRRWPGGETALRRHIGLISQRPSVFPGSILANTLFGLPRRERRHGRQRAVDCLRRAALWDEVADRLDAPASSLSIGQQQRLCLARALAVEPRILMLDEPTASLDPLSRRFIETSLAGLARTVPLLLVTHDLDQARRLSERIVFVCDGRIVETAATEDFFTRPSRIESREFVRWRVCDCDERRPTGRHRDGAG